MKKKLRVSESQLVDIYIIALDSFVPKGKAISINNADYLAIDMSSQSFNNISQEGKQQILDYFKNKYNIDVINASLETLKEQGLTSSNGNDVDLISNNKNGILLGILSIKNEYKTKIVVEGYWFFTSVASEGIRSIVVLEDGQWQLKESNMIWMS